MRIFVASAGTAPHHISQRDHFVALGAADDVGAHQLAPSPADAQAVLFVDLQQHPDDPFLRVLRRHPVALAHPEKVCVYDERDDPFVSFPGIYVAATPRLARRRAVAGGPYPWLQTTIPRSDAKPDLLFSFSGARTHAVRDAVLAITHPRGRLKDTSGLNFFHWTGDADASASVAAREEYVTTVQRSKFVLCPRGHGPSSFRLYETLAAGRVPVVISDDWLPPPRIDWAACAVRVPERDVAVIPALLDRLEGRWSLLAAGAVRTFDEHFASARLWNHYATTLSGLLPADRPRPWWGQREVARLTTRRARGTIAGIRRYGPSDSGP